MRALPAKGIQEMNQHSVISRIAAALKWFVGRFSNPFSGYEPGQHYMRGPGPKWKDKYDH